MFLLRNAPRMNAEVTLDDGWTATVLEGMKAVIVRGPAVLTSCDQTHSAALRAANNALDYMCVRGLCDSAIRDDFDDCLVWWPDPAGGVTLRLRMVHTRAKAISVTLAVTDADGKVVLQPPTPPITAAQHDAFRFIRMSRTSEYLFDSYRNMFLALERLLSDIRPRAMHPNGKPAESEKDWFTAALKQADALVPVAKLAPPGEKKAIDWVYTNMYCVERSGLMHAKPGRYHLPQNDAGRADLRKSLNTLSEYVSELVSVHRGIQRGHSGIYASGWQYFTTPFFEHMLLVIADKELPTTTAWDNETDEMVLSNYVVDEPKQGGPPVAEESMLITKTVAVEASQLSSSEIHTIAVVGPFLHGRLILSSELSGPMTLGTSISQLEVIVGLRNLNVADMPHFSA